MSLGLIWVESWAVQGLGGSWGEDGLEPVANEPGEAVEGRSGASRRRLRGTIDPASRASGIQGHGIRNEVEEA